MDLTVLEPYSDLDSSLPNFPLPPFQIRSLALSISSLFLGTTSGVLVLLSTLQRPPEFVRSIPVSGSPVEDLVPLPEIGRVLVVSGGLLFLVDLEAVGPVQRIGGVKGVDAVSRRFAFGDSCGSDPIGDVDLWMEPPKPGILKRFGGGIRANGGRSRGMEAQREGSERVCFVTVGVVGGGVVLMELGLVGGVESAVSVIWREVLGFDSVMSLVWVDDSVIVGSLEGYTLFSVGTGEKSLIFSLPESSGRPRLTPLCRSKKVLLMVDNVGVFVDGRGQPVGGSLVFRSYPDSVVEMSLYVVTLEDVSLRLYRKKTGRCVQSIAIPKGGNGPCIMVCDEHGGGETVVVATSSKVICLRKLSADNQIKDLLRKKYYKEAVCLMEELELVGEITEEMRSFVHAQLGFILLFEMHFEDAVNHFLLSETMQPSEIFPFIMQDPNRWSSLVPRNRYWGLHPPPMLLEQVISDGLMAIQRAVFLRKAGVDTSIDEDYLTNPPSRGNLLESAIKNIARYLRACRHKDLDYSVREGVDTLLMYLYRALNLVDDMERLASSTNSCVVEELEKLLKDSGHLRTLAFLYASNGMISKALAIWRILARNYLSGLWEDSTITGLQHHGDSSKLMSGQKAAAIEASKLLEQSSDQDLVLEHLGWIADEDQELALRVLTSDHRNNQLSPGEVLAIIDPQKVEIRQRYLQWLIEDEGSDDIQLHTMYALSLAKSAIEAVEVDDNVEDHLKRNITNKGSKKQIANSIRERLQLFLQSSDLYDPEEVLYLIKDSELWLEKAILYKKLGRETWVLQILALKLEDSEAAEQYCAELGRNDAYMQLLDMYLDPQNGKEPMFDAAVRLLHKYGESLDPLQILEKLSPEMPLQLASPTILKLLRARVHHYRQGQIIRSLSSALCLDANMGRLEERSRHVHINDESLCSSCHTRLGTKLLAMYPDDSVVCYKCYRRQGESRSARGRSFKHDIVFKPGWLVTRES